MAPRASWKGFLKLAELSFPVALYSAASTSERIAFHTLNRATGHRVHRQLVDAETGDPVEPDAQVKGYEVGKDEYAILEPDEIAAAVPESDKILSIEAFIGCTDIDDVYLDRPYYLAPADPIAGEAFAILREGIRKKKVAALARTLLFRRVRSLLIRAQGHGLVATTLHFGYEVRSASEAFAEIPEVKIAGEMLDLAKHIIAGKTGEFDPSKFDDRYETALADLVRAKLEGKPIAPRKPPEPTKVVDLMEALRQSAGAGKGKAAGTRREQNASGATRRRRKAS